MEDPRLEPTEPSASPPAAAPATRPSKARRRLLWGAGTVLVLGAALVLAGTTRYPLNEPVVYDDPTEHFKYGSIGADIENGLPLRVMQVLPAMFPEHLPPGAPQDWTAFGFQQEEGREMPIGFSVRTRVVPRTGLTCAACHSGAWRASPDAEPMRFLGMPATSFDVQAMFAFLFEVVRDPRFTTANVLDAMEAQGQDVSALDRLVYRWVIPNMKERLLSRETALSTLFTPDSPPFGPGRVAAFNTFKVDQMAVHYADGFTDEERIGTADYPAVWNQGIRDHWPLNWDGNSTVVLDRNVGAAFGAGATRDGIDMASLERVTAYLSTLPAPRYPFAVDTALAAQGAGLYRQYCFSCHDPEGDRVGTVVPIEEIGTDRHRLDSYTDKLNELLQTYGDGYDFSLASFARTNGYANTPLDGVWARAPYLHNGSVPTLRDLLTPAERRNGGARYFYTGHTVYDSVGVGVRADLAERAGRPSFRYDLTLPGNGNGGHTGVYYGTELSEEEKDALIEFLKTL